jgi:hypothetical protein
VVVLVISKTQPRNLKKGEIIMNRTEIMAYALASAICVATVGTGAIVSNVIMNGDTKEINTVNMSEEEIRLLELWME